VVEGDKGNSRHAWNKLEINDKTWYFDLTFEDYFYPRTGKYCWMTKY
jgi:transglutaminase/protease-like cytokinesis protein 3